MSFCPISKIIKAYDKKVRLEQTKKDENSQSNQKLIKKLSKSSQAYKLFLDKKSPVQVAIDLDLEFPRVRKYWLEYLRLKNMTKLYNIYIQNEYHLDYIFKIYYFMLRNEISIKDMENVLRAAKDVMGLNQMSSNLKAEIERWKQTKNNYLENRNMQPVPLGPLPGYYSW